MQAPEIAPRRKLLLLPFSNHHPLISTRFPLTVIRCFAQRGRPLGQERPSAVPQLLFWSSNVHSLLLHLTYSRSFATSFVCFRFCRSLQVAPFGRVSTGYIFERGIEERSTRKIKSNRSVSKNFHHKANMRLSGAVLLSTAFAGLVASQGCKVKPVGDNPAGNPIHTPVNQVVPAGTPFTITWTVSLQIKRPCSSSILNASFRIQLPATSPSTSSAAPRPTSFRSPASSKAYQISANSSGHRVTPSPLMSLTMAFRSSIRLQVNTNTRPKLASPTQASRLHPPAPYPSSRKLATAKLKLQLESPRQLLHLSLPLLPRSTAQTPQS